MQNLIGTNISATCQLPDYWKATAATWVETINKMCESFQYNDAPWEYLERTNSAILASSLTANGAFAMPETYVMRNGIIAQQAERVDICLVSGDQNTTAIELVECKLTEYDGSKPITFKRVAARLTDASAQVKNITGLHGNQIRNFPQTTKITHSAVVIGLPYFEQKIDIYQISEYIQEIIVALETGPNFDVTAWCFPEPYLNKPSGRYKKYYPGTFLAAKVA